MPGRLGAAHLCPADGWRIHGQHAAPRLIFVVGRIVNEPHLRSVNPNEDRLERLEERHEEFAAAIERRMAALEKWQAFVFGACAAIGALVGIGLTVAGFVLR